MAVAGQLDGRDAAITYVDQRAQRGAQIELAFAKHAVRVFAVGDVIEVHVDQLIGKRVDAFDDVFAVHQAVSEVERQAKVWWRSTHAAQQFLIAEQVFDKHAGLGFKGNSDGKVLGKGGQLAHAAD